MEVEGGLERGEILNSFGGLDECFTGKKDEIKMSAREAIEREEAKLTSPLLVSSVNLAFEWMEAQVPEEKLQFITLHSLNKRRPPIGEEEMEADLFYIRRHSWWLFFYF